MIPFHYQLNIEGRDIRGKLYSHTGTYIAGKKSGANTKKAFEKMAVCDVNGKVRTANINYIIDPPQQSTITLFYFKQGRRYRLFQIYIHESDSFHGVSDDLLNDMITSTLRISVLHQLWSDLLTYVTWTLITLSALFAVGAVYHLGDEGLVSIISATLMSVVLFFLRGPLINQLGGTQRMRKTMHNKLIPLCRRLISTLAKTPRKAETAYREI